MSTTARRLARRLTALVAGLGVVLSLTIVGTAPAHADTIQVTNTNDSGSGSLREALAEAQATPGDDEITFAPSVTGTIVLTSGELDVTVGGTSGSLTIEGPGRDVLAVDPGGQSRVLDVLGQGGDTTPTALISGLTLTGGSSDDEYTGPDDQGGGGALRARGTSVTLSQVAVSDSLAARVGGGVSVEGGSLLVTGSTINGNTAGPLYGAGGGIYFNDGEAAGSTLVVNDSTISDNTVGSFGGGINTWGPAPVTVTGSTVSGNTAAYVQLGSEAVFEYGEGGGINGGDVTVVDSRISDNEAHLHGGGVSGWAVVVTGSTIAHNLAGGHGGGIRARVDAIHDEEVRLESSTVTGNRANLGGGLHVAGEAPVQIRLSTMAANAAVTGGGLFSNTGAELQGTIVGMNSGGDLAGDGQATLAHSLVQDPQGFPYVDAGGSIVGLDPLLGSLADHGGPTETRLPASNSPAVDHGDAFGEHTDQRGSPRPVGGGADIGAVELTETELTGPPQVGNSARPAITGTAQVGETLRTDGGRWAPEGVELTYQWLRDGVAIAGATSASYQITTSDYGSNLYGDDQRKRLSVRVTAWAAGYRSGVVESDYTDPVAPGVFAMARPAQVTGRTRVGEVLRARPRLGAISPRPTELSVWWFLDGEVVRSALDDRRLELKPRMRGQRVKVQFVYKARGVRKMSVTVRKQRPVR